MKRIRTHLSLGLIGLLVIIFSVNGIRRVSTNHKVVALSFDDGPNPPFTDQLLQILDNKQVTATFFLIGQQVKMNPETALLILKNGHEIGGHSSDWKSLAFRSNSTLEQKLRQMNQDFADVGIMNVSLFRPPGGFLFPWQTKALKNQGLTHISADVIAGDWKAIDAQTIRDRVLKKVRPGSIIALHDGGGDRSATIAAVPMIIDELRSQGYEIVSVGRLLQLKQR